MQPPTYAAGVRRLFEDLPAAVTQWVAGQLGGPVEEVRNVHGGFSPGVAAVVRSATGRALFVKAVGSHVNAGSVTFYRREGEQSARLPDLDGIVRPVAWTEMDVADEAYVVLAFPALEGAPPPHPWRPDHLEAALDALQALSEKLTPFPGGDLAVPPRLPQFFGSWERIVADTDDPWHDVAWVRDRRSALVAAEAQLRDELAGDTLSHTDLRADNLVISAGRVWFVDWAHAENAARWADGALLMADVIASRADLADGGEVDVTATLHGHRYFSGVSSEAVWRLMVGLAGALHEFSREPSPPGLPTIRGWQHSTSVTLLGWCQREAPVDWSRPQPTRMTQ